ncbi:digestive organ expansion factor homolog [Teleopsis dalmanni]|uniref:digestive organ expansion factor homolog n=1 Tax=Teleopsis dalmanni TaxID=139649 RepID=UPI0018CF3FED|nr:digestive organ expansion factor homolog [Teleopsis dalmanni]
MAPRSKQKNPNKWKKSKNYKKQPTNKIKNGIVDKKRKNYKFIQRGKEMEEFHRKQKVYEDKYANTPSSTMYNDLALQDLGSTDEEDEDHFEALVTAVSNTDTKNNVLSDDDTESDDNESSEMDSKSEDSDLSEAESDKHEDEKVPEDIDEFDTDESEDEDDDDNEKEIHENKQIFDVLSDRLEYELTADHVENLLATPPALYKQKLMWPAMKNINLEVPYFNKVGQESNSNEAITKIQQSYTGLQNKLKRIKDVETLDKMCVKTVLSSHINLPLSQLQTEVFTILNNYQDIFFPHRSLENGDELRQVFCLHALNHMLKTRSRIVHHNAKITALTQDKKKAKSGYIVPDSYRDQGLVRPKILFIVPFRETAFGIVNTLTTLLLGETGDKSKSVINYERFVQEYTGNTISFPKTNPKPEDYVKTFSGNTDDNFRIGITITKKCLKLYTEFYASDILIASPLGLRMIVGAAGTPERDYDFLNSIEMLIIDQAELILAQNWENLLHVMEHMHLPLKSLHNTDFQRVRPWCLNGYSNFYRQTVLLTSHDLPEFRSIFNHKCTNYQGKIRVTNPVISGSISNVIINIPQIFHRVDVNSLESSFDKRFDYFINEILPRYRNPSHAHCMIYVPSYFDYVRLRNYFKSETVSFVQICEYTKDAKIARSRDMFYHSGAHFLLYSERSHFFRRTRIKGIRHLIMYQPPIWPNFYSEVINLMHRSNQNSRDGLEGSMSITVLYTKYDTLQLSNILGTENAAKLMKSNETSYAFSAE